METPLIATISLAILACGVYYLGLRRRNIHLWIGHYLRRKWRLRRAGTPGTRHVLFCFVDHYEPLVGGTDLEAARRRVNTWVENYPRIADKYRDADGIKPRHTFFYPEEEYREPLMESLVGLCRKGYGEIEVHIHHDNDTEQGFVEKMSNFINILSDRFKALPEWKGRPVFAFIHGNWALDNSRADGRWCGINNEITLLRDLGCYADFTMPSATSDTQTSTVNEIYYVRDDPDRPKSHDTGCPVIAGRKGHGDLLLIQGPLSLNWKRRKLLVWPRVEDADVTPSDIPLNERVDLWVNEGVHVTGRPEWLFVKVHTHGAHDHNSDYLFGGALDELFGYLNDRYNDGDRYRLHYVSAREMYNIVKAAEDGKQGDPGQYRDYLLKRVFQAPGR